MTFASSYSFSVPSGSYTFTVRDANGCTTGSYNAVVDPISGILTILFAYSSSISSAIRLTVIAVSFTTTTDDETCFGSSDGRISITASGGSGGYTYWVCINLAEQWKKTISKLMAG